MRNDVHLPNPESNIWAFGAAFLGMLWAAGFALLPDYLQFTLSAAGTADWRGTMEMWAAILRHAVPLRV